MLLTKRNNFLNDPFFNDPFFNDPFFNNAYQNRENLMRTDIQDDGANYILDVELPGFKKENVRAELKDGYLTVFAETASSKEEADDKQNYIHKERFSGSCKRSFHVGSQLRQEDIKASFENGILKLIVPKEAPKQVEEDRFITIE